MNTIKILRPRFLNPMCRALDLPIGSLCVVSRKSFDGQREVWAVALDYQGRRFPHIILGDETGSSISWIKNAIKPAVELIERAFALPEFVKRFAAHKEDALLCKAIELGFVEGIHRFEFEDTEM